jgi:hypothetical protein
MSMINLFQIILRSSYDALPPVVRHFHEARLGHFDGNVVVTGSNSVLARLLRKLGDLPEPKGASPLVFKLIRTEVQERWLRQFGAAEFASTFTRVHKQNLLCENAGMFRFYYTLNVKDQRIHWHCVSWSLLGIPLPDGLSPDVEAWEGSTAEGHYQFKVNIQLPLVGHLLGYEGELVITTAATAATAE